MRSSPNRASALDALTLSAMASFGGVAVQVEVVLRCLGKLGAACRPGVPVLVSVIRLAPFSAPVLLFGDEAHVLGHRAVGADLDIDPSAVRLGGGGVLPANEPLAHVEHRDFGPSGVEQRIAAARDGGVLQRPEDGGVLQRPEDVHVLEVAGFGEQVGDDPARVPVEGKERGIGRDLGPEQPLFQLPAARPAFPGIVEQGEPIGLPGLGGEGQLTHRVGVDLARPVGFADVGQQGAELQCAPDGKLGNA